MRRKNNLNHLNARTFYTNNERIRLHGARNMERNKEITSHHISTFQSKFQ